MFIWQVFPMSQQVAAAKCGVCAPNSLVLLSPGQTRKYCGNICDSRCFLECFRLPTCGNIVEETKFASREAKLFPSEFRNV
jgi:hypothetical protein